MITKPMLACDFDPDKLQFPLILQPKIDGVRGIHIRPDLGVTARSLKPFGNKLVSEAFKSLPLGIDGELTYGSFDQQDLCRITTSVVNTHDDPRTFDLALWAFDYITPDTVHLPYKERLATLYKLRLPDNVIPIPYVTINSLQELEQLESSYLTQGVEGVILRSPDGLYKNGRSTVREGTFLRVKRFTQEDAIVLEIVEAMENTNPKQTNELGRSERSTHKENLVPKGMVGALVCRDIKTGQTITVGPGQMPHTERKHFFDNPSELVGQTISYKFFPQGQKDLPRFATYVTIRPQEDLVKE